MLKFERAPGDDFAGQRLRLGQIRRRTFDVQNRSLLGSLGVAALFPLVFITDDLIRGNLHALPAYSTAFVALAVASLGLLISKKIEIERFLIFALLIGGVLSTFLGELSQNVVMMVFLCSVPLFYQLAGSKKGLLWNLLLLGFFVLHYSLVSAGFLAKNALAFTAGPSTVVLIATYLLLSIVLYRGARQNELSLAQAHQLNLYYPTTGLPRRQHLADEIESPEAGMLAFIRLENQHELALVHGYGFNDELMKTTAAFLLDYAEETSAKCYQLKDNEYALLFPYKTVACCDENDLVALHDRLENLRFKQGGIELNLHVTIGAAELDHENKATALSLADQALQTALRTHSPVHYYNSVDDSLENTVEKLNRFSLLRKNLESRSLEVFFQPVVDAVTLKPAWYEALLRIKATDGSLASIYPYLTIAESTGQMPRLTNIVISRASAFIERHGKPVSINLSLHDVKDKDLIDFLAQQAGRHHHGHFILEILERDDLSELHYFPAFVEKTRAAGCLIAMDDFGSGYSNFGTLIDLSLDIVKIDGTLVQKSKTDPKALMLIKTLIQFCKHSGLKIVAEHIDTTEQVDLFRMLGVDYLQGFVLGKPQPMGAERIAV